MASSAEIFHDSSLISRFDRALLPFERFAALISGIFAFSLMFLAAWSVTGREFFATPLPGYVDLIEASMPFIAILGVSYVQREGIHIRMDILIGRLSGRVLWALETVLIVTTLFLVLALFWGSWLHFERSFDCARPLCSRDSTTDLNLPLWPSKLVVPIALGLLSLRLMLQAWGYGRGFILGLERPASVPLVQKVADQARAEAAQLEGAEE